MTRFDLVDWLADIILPMVLGTIFHDAPKRTFTQPHPVPLGRGAASL